MTNINTVKEKAIGELKKQDIDVYFIDCYVDDNVPYFVYTFDASIIDEATEYYGNGRILEGVYDDWTFFDCDETDDRLVIDMCDTIKRRLTE